MDNESNLVMVDAIAKDADDINETLPKKIESIHINPVLDNLTVEEYKSMLFLLMDKIGENEFRNIIKQDKICLKQKLSEILKKNNDSLLAELLGILKKYKTLKKLRSCRHVHKNAPERKLINIEGVWQMFYLICEELTDIDLEILKQTIPDKCNQIETAEEWFYWALQKKIISKTDFTSLEKIFHNYPNCLDIIRNFEKPQSYDIRTPTENIDCGIAIILNFETFNSKFHPKRQGSEMDVKSLKEVWNSFGFKTKDYNNLTSEQTLACLKSYAELDHSNYDAFVCCILSHGYSNSIITSDDKEIPIPDLIAAITDNCESLNSKPKLFFIQACQGMNIPQGFGEPVYELESPYMPEPNLRRPPITSDVLLAVSSIDGYVSFRHKTTGSWFIQALCKVMNQKGDKFSILHLMIEVNNIVRKQSFDFGPGGPRNAHQIVRCENTFEKILCLKRRKMNQNNH